MTSTPARARTRLRSRCGSARLLHTPPRIYVGPGALLALRGSRAVLFGARRPAWVDVLEVEAEAGFAGASGVRAILERRFGRGHDRWDAVGVSLLERDSKRLASRLLRELVPGDVLITEGGGQIHMGDAWAPAPLVRD